MIKNVSVYLYSLDVHVKKDNIKDIQQHVSDEYGKRISGNFFNYSLIFL